MWSRAERFQNWRGVNANTEQKYLNTVEYIGNYVDTVETLDAIHADLGDHEAQEFKNFNQFSGRPLGAVALAKLVIDEYSQNLPNDHQESLVAGLNELNNKLVSFYENKPQISGASINDFIAHINTLIESDTLVFVDMKQEKTVLFSLYILLQLVEPSFNSLGKIATMAVSAIVDIEEIKKKIQDLLKKIAAKIEVFELRRLSENKDEIKLDPLEVLQAYFNQGYVNILHNDLSEKTAEKQVKSLAVIAKLTQVEKEMGQVSAHISRLIELRKSKTELELKIKAVEQLLRVVKANDLKISGRAYFLDLIAAHSESYAIFLDSIKGEKREEFLNAVEQLSAAVDTQNFSIVIAKNLSWFATPLTQAYRFATPQAIQDSVTATMPDTWDSQCKTQLKDLAANCLSDLRKQITAEALEIEAIKMQLFGENKELKQLIIELPLEKLTTLQKATLASEVAVRAYHNILFSIRNNMEFLHEYKAHAETLGQFVLINDTFWVRLSNFFAQFLSIFKTDIAKMVDAANECKRKVDVLTAKYQDVINEEIKQIDMDPNVAEDVKRKLKEHFYGELTKTGSQKLDETSLGKREVRLLIKSLSAFFAENPELQIEKCTPVDTVPADKQPKVM